MAGGTIRDRAAHSNERTPARSLAEDSPDAFCSHSLSMKSTRASEPGIPRAGAGIPSEQSEGRLVLGVKGFVRVEIRPASRIVSAIVDAAARNSNHPALRAAPASAKLYILSFGGPLAQW